MPAYEASTILVVRPHVPAPALWERSLRDYVWRLWTVVYAGGMAAFVALPLVLGIPRPLPVRLPPRWPWPPLL